MKCFVTFLAGFGVAAALFLLVVMPHIGAVHERRTAEIALKFDLVRKLSQLLGDDYRNSDGYTPFLEVKTDAIVVVEHNGVKTLRVYADRP